jgi:hypothetical protein
MSSLLFMESLSGTPAHGLVVLVAYPILIFQDKLLTVHTDFSIIFSSWWSSIFSHSEYAKNPKVTYHAHPTANPKLIWLCCIFCGQKYKISLTLRILFCIWWKYQRIRIINTSTQFPFKNTIQLVWTGIPKFQLWLWPCSTVRIAF